MNIVDVLVFLFLLTAAARGKQMGFVRQLAATVGFVAGIFLGIKLGAVGAGTVSDTTAKLLISSVILFATSFGLMSIVEYFGAGLKGRLKLQNLPNKIDSGFGVVLSLSTALFALWFITAFIALMPSSGLQRTVRDSWTYNLFDRNLPPASQLLSGINHYFKLGDTPRAFSGREPSPDSSLVAPPVEQYTDVFASIHTSVVRVQGLGCGGIVNGTGFLLSKTRVMTNAHVVAGIAHPTVHDDEGSHAATVVLFDPGRDIAVLAVETLAGTPVTIATGTPAEHSTVLISGFPGGGELTDTTGVISQHATALGRDIYDQNKSLRSVYVLQATVIPGNSGGPLMNEQGKLIGMVFGTSTTYNNVGYALALDEIQSSIDKAATLKTAISSGSCSTL